MSWVVAILLLVAVAIYVTRCFMRLLPPPSASAEAARIRAQNAKTLHRDLSGVRKEQRELDAIRAMPDHRQRLSALARFVRRLR